MINMPDDVEYIIAELNKNGFEAYVVGGCVRDALLGKQANDWDITTEALPTDVKRIFRRTIDTGIEHGTVSVLLHGSSYELTTYRIDGKYSDARRPDSVVFSRNLSEDLRRRDFTINAMAYAPAEGLIDLYGGMEDLAAGIVRCVGVPEERFSEDALRMLRAVRFAAQLGFRIEEASFASISVLAQNLERISKERIFVELNKILLSENMPYMSMLFKTGLYKYVSPCFALLEETMLYGLDKSAGLPRLKHLRWAAFFSNCDEDIAFRILKELKSDNHTLKTVKLLLGYKDFDLKDDKILLKKVLSKIGFNNLYDIIILNELGLFKSKTALSEFAKIRVLLKSIYDNSEAYSISMLDIKGEDVLSGGVDKGPMVGSMLQKLLDIVIENPELNSREVLINIIKNGGYYE